MTFSCRAILFDLDGTLINSIPAVDRAWRTWSVRNGLDPDYVLPRIHGRRSIDSIRLLAPHLDAEAENLVLRHLESTDTEGVTLIPGAIEFLQALPPVSWTVVTSGTSDVAQARMQATSIPVPLGAVYGEDVANGKPAPDPYLLAADRLGIPPSECLVFEDTLAGVRSAHAAGMAAVAITTTQAASELGEAEAVVADFTRVRAIPHGSLLQIDV